MFMEGGILRSEDEMIVNQLLYQTGSTVDRNDGNSRVIYTISSSWSRPNMMPSKRCIYATLAAIMHLLVSLENRANFRLALFRFQETTMTGSKH